MPLLERVATLIRANLNDLVEKAENPEKLLKQLLLDMQNQFMQVKTQVAIAIADQHLLEKKHRENVDARADWMRKAELALEKDQEDLARGALERSIGFENAARNFAQQLEDQTYQVQSLRDALNRLEQKMSETRTRIDVLIAQHRRARLAMATGSASFKWMEQDAVLDRAGAKVIEAAALGAGHQIASRDMNVEERFAELEKSARVDRMLAELKEKRSSQA